MKTNLNRTAIFLVLLLLLTIVSCGLVVKDPADINGTGEVTLEFEAKGTVSTADVTVLGSDGNVLIGSEAADGTVSPETVALPWKSEEYTYIGLADVFFSFSATNSVRQEQAAGNLSTYTDNLLEDAGAQFTAYVSVGDYAYNEPDGISAMITAVNSNTSCTLNRVFFAESWRTYYVYQKGITITSGTTTSASTGRLIDSEAFFLNKVNTGEDTAANQDDETEAAITGIDNNYTLNLNADIFTTAERYLIRRDALPVTGTTTSTGSYRLIDSGTAFSSDGIAAGYAVENTDDENFAQIVAVADYELTLDKDIFTSTGDPYLIYPVKSAARYSTTQSAGQLIDSGASYWGGVKKGDVVYNPDKEMYGKVTDIDSGTRLDLDTDVFPAVTISYKIYAPRTLTVTVYTDGEEYDSFTSTHWDVLEAALTGVINTLAPEQD